MKYFAVCLPMKDKEKSDSYRNDHLNFLSEQRDNGTVLMNGKFFDGSGGLVIYKGESVEEVTKIVETDPYIVNGAREYEIHEWEMVSNYSF